MFDPIEVFGPGGCFEASGCEIKTPTFYQQTLAPEVQAMKDAIVAADAYLIITPEYNHGIPPALAGLMGHFGGSCYK